MESEAASIEIDKLIKYWNDQGIHSIGNSVYEIINFEISKGIQLPEDFKKLYSYTNGMVDLFPNYMDQEGFLFYPLECVQTLEEEFELNTTVSGERCIVFAEYLHKSWWYGFRINNTSAKYTIGLIPHKDGFQNISDNLFEFIDLYLNDPLRLYPNDSFQF
jgi:hypothetical protein